jgi:hypothetical protein
LPADIVDILERMRSLGLSEQTVRMERDGWILLSALAPELVAGWAGHKRAALDDPDFRCLYVAFDQARDRHPDDLRLEQLAARALDWVGRHRQARTETAEPGADVSVAAGLLAAQLAETSPALRRLADPAKE